MTIPGRRRPLNAYLAQQAKINHHIVGSSDYSNSPVSHNIDNNLVPISPESIVGENINYKTANEFNVSSNAPKRNRKRK